MFTNTFFFRLQARLSASCMKPTDTRAGSKFALVSRQDVHVSAKVSHFLHKRWWWHPQWWPHQDDVCYVGDQFLERTGAVIKPRLHRVWIAAAISFRIDGRHALLSLCIKLANPQHDVVNTDLFIVCHADCGSRIK